MAIRRIGQIIVDLGFINDEQLEILLEEQEQRPHELIGQIALSMNFITDEQLAQALAEQMGLQAISLSELVIMPDVLSQVTDVMAQMYRIVPISFRDDVLTVATYEPQKLQVLDEMRTFLGYDVRAVVTTETDINKALERFYSSSESVEQLIDSMNEDQELAKAAELAGRANAFDLTSVEALADSAPVRKLLNMVLLLAIKDHASDLHS
jgi:type IV pilus assembly protein PilB